MNNGINVMIIANTDLIKEKYTNPSQDKNNPTLIDNNCQCIVCSGSRKVITGQCSSSFNFTADPGDIVSFRGISTSGNSDDAIMIYDVTPKEKENVFNKFITNHVERKKVVISVKNHQNDKDKHLVVKKDVGKFISYDSKVSKAGKENFHIRFALYTLDEIGESQNLFGYFYWDPSITVE